MITSAYIPSDLSRRHAGWRNISGSVKLRPHLAVLPQVATPPSPIASLKFLEGPEQLRIRPFSLLRLLHFWLRNAQETGAK